MYALPASTSADFDIWLLPLGEKAQNQLQEVSSAACHCLPPAVQVPIDACATLNYGHIRAVWWLNCRGATMN